LDEKHSFNTNFQADNRAGERLGADAWASAPEERFATARFGPNEQNEGNIMTKIEIYSKANCGYCDRARSLLNARAIEFQEVDVTMGGAPRQEMLQRAPGHRTTPSIFIDGRHIGGSDELAALDRSGELESILARKNAS
jgi:glutaredoxin 3